MKDTKTMPDFGIFAAWLAEKGYQGYKFDHRKLYDELRFFGLRNPDGTDARGWKSCATAWWRIHKPAVRKHEREERKKQHQKALRDQRNRERQERAYQRHLDWEENHRDYFRAYTDGSCDYMGGNSTGIGGSAYVILQDGVPIHEASIGKACTTNNRMEMLAIISVLNWLPAHSKVVVYSDSEYAIHVFLGHWKPKVNLDLVRMYQEKAARLDAVELSWVKGHHGNEWNEYVDDLAHTATVNMKSEIMEYDKQTTA